jgi:hypothetical protein
MPERVQRVRGVEASSVDTDRSVLNIQLAAENRVRLEQLRDLIEQDGTRATSALVQLRGDIDRTGDEWTIVPAGVRSTYRLAPRDTLVPGPSLVRGTIADLHPQDGRLTIEVTSLQKTASTPRP